VAGVGEFDRPGSEPAAMGEFARSAYRRIVLRSTPVRRAISCWLAPRVSSVAIVTRKCDFKTFNPSLPSKREAA
jgi:hypothetical protein